MRLLALALLAAGPAAAAAPLDLPQGARETAAMAAGAGADLPAGPWRAGEVPRRRFEGAVTRQAWRIDGRDLSVAQIAAPLKAQLRDAGWEIAFDCRDATCGGFDFRFALDTVPAPAMFVDLGDYRYMLALGPEGGALALLVSRARGTGFVHATRVGAEAPPPAVVASTKSGPAPRGDLWRQLSEQGRVALDDLPFETGSARLEGGPFPSLDALAAGLDRAPDARIALVGHTDTAGSLAANRALSRQRAEAVRRALVSQQGIDPGRITAEGVGFLAPRASNREAEGRQANRRVEVVLLE